MITHIHHLHTCRHSLDSILSYSDNSKTRFEKKAMSYVWRWSSWVGKGWKLTKQVLLWRRRNYAAWWYPRKRGKNRKSTRQIMDELEKMLGAKRLNSDGHYWMAPFHKLVNIQKWHCWFLYYRYIRKNTTHIFYSNSKYLLVVAKRKECVKLLVVSRA